MGQVQTSHGPEHSDGTDPSRASEPARSFTVASAERRSGQRRTKTRVTRPVFNKRKSVLLPAWRWITIVVGVTVIESALVSWSLPSPVTSALLALALALPWLTRIIDKPVDERIYAERKRWIVVAACVVVPMIATGAAFSIWVENGGLEWQAATTALLAISGIGAALLYRPLGAMFAVMLSVWMVPALWIGDLVAIAGWMASALAAITIAFLENRIRLEQSNRLRAEERVRQRAELILHDYEETRQGWFWETDRRSHLTYISPPVAAELGYDSMELLGRPLIDLFDLSAEQEGERTLTFHLSARSAFTELPVRSAVEGEELWWSVTGRPLYDSFDNFVGFRGSGTDLTEKKRSQEQATRLAQYDSLTGLANRFQMSQSLEKILSAPQEMNRACAVFLLDLDRFKQVNDTLGHPAGDALLKQVSERLSRVVGEMGRVGRLGGDEFKVIIPGKVERQLLGELAHRIIEQLSHPYSIEGHRVTIGASIGIAISPDNGVTSESLIRNADLALYAAKDGGRGRYHFYANTLHVHAEERRQLEQDLRDAIHQGQLELFYQPVVDAASERIAGFEALMRWRHPEKGMMPTGKFIEIAEDTGLIAQIGEWAIRTACDALATWPEDVRCAVNVSPLQFANPQLPAILTNAIAAAGIEPSRLELEITESVFLNDDENTDAMFDALKRVGVRLALDDFGTGYSSLGYLKKAPFDKIKIDQSFVRGATEPDSRNGAIIASITSLAQALGMDTTAEGVETLDELDLIRLLGCSHVQGYIYEKPLSRVAASERLQTGLLAVARGPRSARAARQTVLRKVQLQHGAQNYNGTIRNISLTGALVEGLWNVPVGTIFEIVLSADSRLTATARWCEEGRMGVEFARPLDRDGKGQIAVLRDREDDNPRTALRKAG